MPIVNRSPTAEEQYQRLSPAQQAAIDAEEAHLKSDAAYVEQKDVIGAEPSGAKLRRTWIAEAKLWSIFRDDCNRQATARKLVIAKYRP